MRKSMKQFFQKSLCGILSAAMLLSGLSIPELTAYAAEADAVGDVEITEQSNNEVVSPGELEQTPDQTDVTDPDLSGDSENSSGGGTKAMSLQRPKMRMKGSKHKKAMRI